jgi:D-alanyl-D-alanine carboxypeptidase/D-alanyl-D-alanine-endopeptidase (penicillin-binding protein 4)
MRGAVSAVVVLALIAASPASALNGRQLTRVLDRQMELAGPYSGVFVEDVETGVPVYANDAATPRTPASVEKLWTTAAVLSAFRDDERLLTTVVKDRPISVDGTLPGDLYLRGSGDPMLTTHDIKDLATQVSRSGILAVRGRVVGDGTAFDARRGLAGSGYEATPDVPPLAALMVDRGQIREGVIGYQPHPALFAAAKLTQELRARGVKVARAPATGRSPLMGWAIAGVHSPTIRHLLKLQNVYSDNYIAETFVKVLGRAGGATGTTARGAAVVRRTAERRYGAAPTVVDGSGISRGNRSSPQDIVTLLVSKVGDRAFVRSLPITGRTGTVAYRLRGPATYNQCRAKTGTLDGVSALAGYCATLGGQTLAFAIINNQVSSYAAHVIQDKMTTAIARYDP